MTVSRVANGAAHVKEETRVRVAAAMRDLGYKPNPMAKGMRNNITNTIGFILPDLANPVNAAVAQTVERIMAAEGYRMLVASTDFKPDHEQHFLEEFQNRMADGLVVLLADETAERSIELLKRSRIPVVLIDRDVAAPLDFVLSDHKTAMTQVVRYLMSLGHTKIGLIVPPMTMRPGRERFNAFCAETVSRGHPPLDGYIRTAIQTLEEGYRAAIDILRHRDRPTALIVGANQHIFGAMRAVRELNLSIPSELSIVGADENVASGLIEPPLTVIWRDMNLVGESAARLLLDRLGSRASEPPRTITIRSEIILRESCGPAPANNEPKGTRLGG